MLLLSVLAFQLLAPSIPQNLTKLGELSPSEATSRYLKYFQSGTTDIKFGVKLYKVTYNSNDGFADQAVSGLLALPARGASKGLVLWFQGTTVDRKDSPSRYDGKVTGHSAEAVVLNFCLDGFAVAIPDCYGLGDNRSVQPYPLGTVNAQAGIDMLEPVREATERLKIEVGSKLFIAGYSEGGAKAMWMTRRMEAMGQRVEASAPMSGPYDLSGATTDWLLKRTDDLRTLAFKFVAAALTGAGAQSRLEGMSLDDIFVPSFSSYVPFVLGQDLGTEDVGKKFLTKGLQLGALRSTDRIFQPDMLKELKLGNPNNPVIALFKQNDCYDWRPKTKMLLPYLPHDSIVVADNTLLAAAHMAETGRVRPIAIVGDRLNHVTAAIPALVMGRAFFNGGFAAVERVQPTIIGSASYRERIALSPKAELIVTLHPTANPKGAIATSRTLIGPRHAPIAFSLSYDPAKVDEMTPYSISAEVRERERTLLRTTRPIPVLGAQKIRKIDFLLVAPR